MKSFFRWSVGAGLLAGLIGGASYAWPVWTARMGLNLSEWLAVQQRLEEEQRREEVLRDEAQRVTHRLQMKRRIVDDVCCRRLSLRQAAAGFRKLDRAAGGCSANRLAWFRVVCPGDTDEERWCRQVICFVRGRDLEDSSLADQFEAELARLLVQGPLSLPDGEPLR